MRRAVCPGSFDPVTMGHLDVFERASKMFDEVIVSVFVNPAKDHGLFSMQERVDMIRKVTAHIPNVKVTSFSGLLNEFCRQQQAPFIVRGLRAFTDFEYEFQRALLMKKIDSNLETVFIMTNAKYSYRRAGNGVFWRRYHRFCSGLHPDRSYGKRKPETTGATKKGRMRVMELDKILDELENVLSAGFRIPLINKVVIDENEVSMALDKLRAAVPLEVKRARDLLEEQKNIIEKSHQEAEHIVEQAHAEGNRIVDLAKAEADRLVRQEEVVKAAEDKANGIIATTQQYDRDMRAAADAYADKLHSESMQYAMDVFNYLEENLNKTLTAVRDNGAALKSSYDAEHEQLQAPGDKK